MSDPEQNADHLPLPPSSDNGVEPKQPEPSAAAELGKGKVVLIMCALCVSPEDFEDSEDSV